MANLSHADLRVAVCHLAQTGKAKSAREKIGPRSEVARGFHADSVSLYRWETGRRVPRGAYLVTYARFLERAGLDLRQAIAEARAGETPADALTEYVTRREAEQRA